MKNIPYIIALIVLIVAVILTINRRYNLYAEPPGDVPQIVEVITIEKNRFIPTLLTVNAGEAVTITNKDTVSYIIQSDPALYYEGFDIGELKAGQSVTVGLQKKGSFKYQITGHPEINGQVIVE